MGLLVANEHVPATAQVPWVPVKNAGGAEIPSFAIMRGTGTTTIDSKPVVTVDKPNTSFQRWYYVNGPVPIPASKTGAATIFVPQVYALYDTADGTPAVGEAWGVANGSHKLRKNRPGFNILQGGTGGRVLVAQHVVNEVVGKTDATHNKGASGPISVFFGPPNSETDPGDFTIQAVNKFANLAASMWVVAHWLNSAWYLVAGECSPAPAPPPADPGGGLTSDEVMARISLGV